MVRAEPLLLSLSIVVLVVLEHCSRPLHEESTHCPDQIPIPSLTNVPSWRAPWLSCFGSFSLRALPWSAQGPKARFWRRGSEPYPIQKVRKGLPRRGPLPPVPSWPAEMRSRRGRSTLIRRLHGARKGVQVVGLNDRQCRKGLPRRACTFQPSPGNCTRI